MDLKTTKASNVLTEPSSPISKSRLGLHSSVMPSSQSGTSFSSTVQTVPRIKKPPKLDDIRSNGWLEAMKSSSPPRKKIVKSPFAEVSSDDSEGADSEGAYHAWQLKFPSALTCFEKIIECGIDKKIVVFLDYDGTLSPIVDDPDRAFMSADMRSAVRNAAKHFPTAIISGRRRDMVCELVGLTELYYAGSHGMDIKFPLKDTGVNSEKLSDLQDKEFSLFQPAREYLPMIEEVFGILVNLTKDINGAKVENHKFCASVHYRNVDEKSWSTIGQLVLDVLKDYPRLRLTHGRKVLEVRPGIDWNKGKAVEFLLESMNLGKSEGVLPIYIGDDKTDEDAFQVLRQGNRGYGILVSSTPKDSTAFFSLKDPEEVKEFLKALVNWKVESMQ